MTSALIQKLRERKDLKHILETTVGDLTRSLNSNCCQILLANPLETNSALICESYAETGPQKTDSQTDLPRLSLPLVLNGRSFGSLILIRNTPWLASEIDSTTLLIAKLSELIREAQFNDLLQRQTFQSNFLVEINNLMAYSLGIGDALFMVVNILGKALRASRCLFVCTDDKTSGWKCYEFWQQDKVKSCQEYHWPTNDSSLIAQTLRTHTPLKFYEGQENSYLTPSQAELQFSETRSLLAMSLQYENNVYGCVIIQQCDYRRSWTRDEMDMVQHAADRVAQALANLPEEKRIHKPIMQLHQRIVAPEKTVGGLTPTPTGAALAQSLKGAFGQKSIPSAVETAHELPAQEAPVLQMSLKPVIKPAKRSSTGNKLAQLEKKDKETQPPPQVSIAAPNIVPVKAKAKSKGTQSAGGMPAVAGAGPGTADTTQAPAQDRTTAQRPDGISVMPDGSAAAVLKPALPESEWGNLDAIPTPAAGPAKSGLGAYMLPKAKAQSPAAGSQLRASLHKEKALSLPDETGESTTPPDVGAGAELQAAGPNGITQMPLRPLVPVSSSDVGTAVPVSSPIETEEQAKEKIERALAASDQNKQVSDYIFAIADMDPRTLGRIAGWVEEIEKKDKYLTPHAKVVAEYSCAIAEGLHLSPRDIADVKIAALLHDVGKLGTSAEILQKRDEDLDDAELLTIMRHPMDGAELLKSIPDLASFAPIVLAHHEEYAGNGYPQGLKGEEIPLAARIIFLANSYHGMISEMRYGKGMPFGEAVNLLQQGAGNHYDPALVDVFIEYLQK